MAVNTPFLGTPSNATTVLSDLSIAGTLDVGVVESAGAITGTVATLSSVSLTAGDTGVIIKSVTTSSAASSGGAQNVADGGLALMESTLTNVTLIYRSGNTVYHWVSSNGSTGA